MSVSFRFEKSNAVVSDVAHVWSLYQDIIAVIALQPVESLLN